MLLELPRRSGPATRRSVRRAPLASPVVATLLAVAGGLCGSAGGLAAQGEVELGVDAGVRFDLDGTETEAFSIAVPLPSLRLGLHLMRRFSLEARFGYQRRERRDITGSPTFTEVEAALYGMYHLGSDIRRPRFHLLLGVPVQRLRATQGEVEEADWDVGALGGIGLTAPVTGGWGVRIQAQGIGWEGAGSRASITVGFSAFVD